MPVPGLCIRTVSSIFISGTLACLLTVKLEENLYVCLAKHSIQYKILTEPVGGFYTSPVLATKFFCYLHNLFEHNTDYLMSYPTGVLLLHVLQQLKLDLTCLRSCVVCKTNVLHVWFQFYSALRAQCAHYTL